MEIRIRGKRSYHYLVVTVEYDVTDRAFYAWCVEANWPAKPEDMHAAGVMGDLGCSGLTIQEAVDQLLQRVRALPHHEPS